VLVTSGFILIISYFRQADDSLELAQNNTDVPNRFHPDQTSSTERLDEVARLLALGYLRLRARRQAENATYRTT
jgi:hypothetical protein